jgi:8-oxo-dGTP pyrophosphatase MutT (NUDIX family)
VTPGSSREQPIVRPTARVLLLDGAGRTMLFTANTPDEDTGLPFWFPPGGGLEPGETHEEAAAREMMEETGLSVALERGLWTRTWRGQLAGVWYEVLEKFFLARCEDPAAITVDSWTELELQTIKEYRWWSLDEIEASDGRSAVFVPRELPRLFPAILAGTLPAEPFAVD